MKRLVLFSFFDKQGIVDDYIYFLVEELLSVATDFFFVVNGDIASVHLENIIKVVTNIIIRDNIGFDGGAYRDVIINYIGEKQFQTYDEVVFCNDTFFGPFCKLKDIWIAMNEKECDFWGLNFVESNIIPHLESYFLVFKKNIISTNTLFDYLKNRMRNDYDDIQVVISDFEDGLFMYMLKNGYKYSSYVEVNNINIYKHSYTLLAEYNLPIIKKKAFSINSNSDLNEVAFSLEYIRDYVDYNIEMIYKSIYRLYGLEKESINILRKSTIEKYNIDITNQNELKDFINDSCDIYLFGIGLWGKRLFHLFLKNNNNFKGFVVSEKKEENYYGYPIFQVDELLDSAHIIVSAKLQFDDEIYSKLEKSFKCFFLWNK